MNIIALTAVGAGVLAFGPGFLVQAGIGYLAGTFAGAYCENKMHKLHNEICRHTGNSPSDMNCLGRYALKASQVGGVLCPVIPVVAAGVGMYCDHKAERLRSAAAGQLPPLRGSSSCPRSSFGHRVINNGVRL